MQGINVMIKPVSGRCNMSCQYCFYEDEIAKRRLYLRNAMSEETLKQVVRKTIFRAEKQIHYIFQGGEPTLRRVKIFERFVEFEERYNKNNIIIHNDIQTNGILIDEKWCKFLRKNQF